MSTAAFTPQENTARHVEGLWGHFQCYAQSRTGEAIKLELSGQLSSDYGTAVKQFVQELQAKGWNVEARDVKRSWFAVWGPESASRHEIHLSITQKAAQVTAK